MKTDGLSFKIKEFEKKQQVIAVIVFFILSGIAVILNNFHLTSLAQENTKYLTRFITIGDKREVTLVLNQAHITNFSVIKYVSKNGDQNFTIPARSEIESKSDFFQSLVYDKVTTEVISSISSSNGDQIVYEFNRFRLVPYAIILWIFLILMSIPQLIFLKRRLVKQFEKDLEFERKASKIEIASQVRHNLRTPLAALMRIPQKLPANATNEKELLNITIKQIQDLIEKLDIEKKSDLSKNNDKHIFDTLVSARQEINLTIPSHIDFKFEIADDVSASLVNHVPVELRSILSNMVNNSVEAIASSGKILVQVSDKITNIEIKVTDTGCGIPIEIQNKIFSNNFSYNKKAGSGIGLSHAKEFIEGWHGSIKVESIEHVGTTFIIQLPVKDKESWYLPRLKVNNESKIYVLDDQESALALWKQKLGDSQLLEQSVFCQSSKELIASGQFDDRSIFLVDYDLGAGANGLQILQQLPKDSLRCLVTGHFDDRAVRDACVEQGLFLIPKSMIERLSIVY